MDTSKFVKGMLLVWVPLLAFAIRAFVVLLSQRNTGLGAAPDGIPGRELIATVLLLAAVTCEVFGGFLLFGALTKGQPLRNFLSVASIAFGSLFVIVQGVTTAILFLRSSHS